MHNHDVTVKSLKTEICRKVIKFMMIIDSLWRLIIGFGREIC